ncbi:MAG: hypothetical protein LZF64_13140, partial [Nitrosomonas sp.]
MRSILRSIFPWSNFNRNGWSILNRYQHPEIFNTDQGAQFTAEAWICILKNHGIQISMDGKGRYHDNIFIERLWR